MNKVVKEGKKKAVLAYLTFIGTLIAWSLNSEEKNKFASFHIRQAIGIDILWIVFSFLVSGFDRWYLSFPFWLICMVLWTFGFVGALQGKLAYIPFFGNYFQKWFKKIA